MLFLKTTMPFARTNQLRLPLFLLLLAYTNAGASQVLDHSVSAQAGQSSADCRGLDLVRERDAAFEANPYRAGLQPEYAEDVHICLEGEIIDFCEFPATLTHPMQEISCYIDPPFGSQSATIAALQFWRCRDGVPGATVFDVKRKGSGISNSCRPKMSDA